MYVNLSVSSIFLNVKSIVIILSVTEAYENGNDAFNLSVENRNIPRVASFADSPSLAMGEVRPQDLMTSALCELSHRHV